jgi:tetratricopeptide (TPR) repeat protein
VSNRTADVDSYQQYLRARALFRARDLEDVITILEPLVARDPNYAPAWALLAGAYLNAQVLAAEYREGSVEETRRAIRAAMDKAERAAREAIRLDPSYGGGYGQLGRVERFRGNWVTADDLTRQALMLDPNDAEILGFYGQRLSTAGRIEDALRVMEQLSALEPFVPIFNMVRGGTLSLDGQHDAAIRMLEAIPADGPTNYARNANLASAYAEAGRYAEAADTLLLITDQSQVSRETVEEAARILRSAPAKISTPEALPALGSLDFVYAHVGAFERIWQNSEREEQIRPSSGLFVQIWHRSHAPLRKTERFKSLVRRVGLVDYWRARGWPDLCRPVGADDFVCD